MNWNKAMSTFRKTSPMLCTLIGVTGVVATAILTAKHTPKAMERIKIKQEQSEEPLTTTEKIIAAAPAYLPAAGAATITIVAIISSNLLNHRQNLSLAATCSLLQHNFKDYRSKVKELFGDDADMKVETAVAKSRFDPSKIVHCEPHGMDEIYIWMEPNTGQVFEATEADVVKAEYTVNRLIAKYGYCSLAEYCGLLSEKLEKPVGSENIGWDVEDFAENWGGEFWVEFYHEFVESPDADIPPYYIIHTPITPEWDFTDEHRPMVELYIDDDGCYAYDVR